MSALESFVGEKGIENFVKGYLKGRPDGTATEEELMGFLDRISQTFFVARLLKMAAEGQFSVSWSDEDNDFVFTGLKLKDK